MKSINEQRIDEYNEEIAIIDKGIAAYEDELLRAKTKKEIYEAEHTVFKMKIQHKSKTAASLQLSEIMKQNDIKMKADIKEMKENFSKILKKAMDIKDKLPRDLKTMVLGFKNARKWKSDNHKLSAYNTLKNVINQHSNGKSI